MAGKQAVLPTTQSFFLSNIPQEVDFNYGLKSLFFSWYKILLCSYGYGKLKRKTLATHVIMSIFMQTCVLGVLLLTCFAIIIPIKQLLKSTYFGL